MTPPAWLLVAAAVLALVAGWCANAEAALALVSATGAAERAAGTKPGNRQSRLGAVAADLPRYMSVLLLLRAICEVFAAVLVTAAFVRWLGDDWRAVLAALATALGLRYVLTGVRPQTGRAGPRTERTAERAAAASTARQSSPSQRTKAAVTSTAARTSQRARSRSSTLIYRGRSAATALR